MFIPDPKSGRLPIAYTPSFDVETGFEPVFRESKSRVLPARRLDNIENSFTLFSKECAVYARIELASPHRQ